MWKSETPGQVFSVTEMRDMIRDRFEYQDGKLIRKSTGVEGLGKCGDGYKRIVIRNTKVRTHHAVWLMFNEDFPVGKVLDHIDGNPLNNRIENLRQCTQAQNRCNTRKYKGVSRYKGVSWDKSRKMWLAMIRHHGKTYNLGGFLTQSEAAERYNEEAVTRFGEFASLNVIEGDT